MRKTSLIALLCTILLTGVARAQDCFNCVLGIFDEQAMVNTSGTLAQNTPKTLWLGIQLANGETGVTGIEFSVSGLQGLQVLGTPAVVQEAVRIGTTILAPADTSETTIGQGGFNLSWDPCREGTQALVKINIISFTAPPTDRVIEVKRKYPTSNPIYHTPLIVGCDAPFYTVHRVTGGCYIMNPTGAPVPCGVAVTPRTWTEVKSLYD